MMVMFEILAMISSNDSDQWSRMIESTDDDHLILIKLPTSSIKAMKSRAVQGSHVFELEPYHMWKFNQQHVICIRIIITTMRQCKYYHEDDDAFGRCHGIQPIVLSTSRMPHSSLGAYISLSDRIMMYLNVSISDHTVKYPHLPSHIMWACVLRC